MEQKHRQESEREQKRLFLLLFFLLSMTSIILGLFGLEGADVPFIQRHFVLLSITFGVLICLLFSLSAWSIYAKKDVIVKGMLILYVFLVFASAVCLVLLKTGFFRLVNSPETLQEYLEKTGAWMPVLYIVLQYLQVVLLPIPTFVSTVAGVALFGSFWAMIYSLVGVILGSITAFFIGRKLGNKAVAWMVGEETLTKWQTKLKGKDKFFLTVMFLLPLFPDDVLCFLAGLSTMTTQYFLKMILIARIIGISTTCYSINLIPFTTWWGIAIWVLLGIAIIVGFIFINKNMEKIQRIIKNFFRKDSKN